MSFIDKFKNLFGTSNSHNVEQAAKEPSIEQEHADCGPQWQVTVTMNNDGSLTVEKSESLPDDKCLDALIASREEIKNEIVRTIGNDEYGANLDHIDYELAMAYKEADYQILRADTIKAELEYYKAANDLHQEFSGPRLYAMWNHYLDLKKRLDSFS